MSLSIPSAGFRNQLFQELQSVGNLYAPFFSVTIWQSTQEFGDFLAELPSLTQGQATQGSVVFTSGLHQIGASVAQITSRGGVAQTFFGETSDPLAEIAAYRSSLNVRGVAAGAYRATLTLNPPYEDALRLIESGAIKFGSIMDIQWGYMGSIDTEAILSERGLFTLQQPSIRFGQQCQIQLVGWDMMSTSLKSLDTRQCYSREGEFKTDLDILKHLVESRMSGVELVEEDLPQESTLRQEKDVDVVQEDDDWSFFRRICRANDVGFISRNERIILYDISTRDLKDHSYRLLWYANPENERDIPMISFETNTIAGYFARAGSRGQTTTTFDKDTGKAAKQCEETDKTGKGHTGSPKVAASEGGHKTDKVKTSRGSVATWSDKDNSIQDGRMFTIPLARPNQSDEAKKRILELRRTANTWASAVCPGVPSLIPQMIVRVEGIGSIFTDAYRVTEVSHDIGSGYTMKLKLLRSGSDGNRRGPDPTSNDRSNDGGDSAEGGGSLVDSVPVGD